MSDDEDEAVAYEMVMPFVTVASKGGPHDDEAYVCGWECGSVDSRLTVLARIGGTVDATVHEVNLPQMDLVAMKHGFRMVQQEVEEPVEGWTFVRFEVAAE